MQPPHAIFPVKDSAIFDENGVLIDFADVLFHIRSVKAVFRTYDKKTNMYICSICGCSNRKSSFQLIRHLVACSGLAITTVRDPDETFGASDQQAFMEMLKSSPPIAKFNQHLSADSTNPSCHLDSLLYSSSTFIQMYADAAPRFSSIGFFVYRFPKGTPHSEIFDSEILRSSMQVSCLKFKPGSSLGSILVDEEIGPHEVIVQDFIARSAHLEIDFDDFLSGCFSRRSTSEYGMNLKFPYHNFKSMLHPAAIEYDLQNLFSYVDQLDGGLKAASYRVGCYGSVFCIRTELEDLPLANLLVYGAPKIWYIIAPQYYGAVDALVKQLVGAFYPRCSNPSRHKSTLLDPRLLQQHGIPFTRVVQRVGDLVVLLPRVFHFGFDVGPNIAMAVNYGTLDWYDEVFCTKGASRFVRCDCGGKLSLKQTSLMAGSGMPESIAAAARMVRDLADG